MQGNPESLLSSIADTIISCQTVRDVLACASEQLGCALEVSRSVSVLSRIGDGAQSRYHPPIEWSRDETDPSDDRFAIALAERVALHVAHFETTLSIPEAGEHPVLDDVAPEIDALAIRSLLAVPATCDGTVRGALLLYQCNERRQWSAEEIHFVERVAHFVGVSLQRLLLEEERETDSKSVSLGYTSIPTITVDDAGAVTGVNEAFLQTFEASESGVFDVTQTAAQTLFDLVVLEQDKPLVRNAIQALVSGESSSICIRARTFCEDTVCEMVIYGERAGTAEETDGSFVVHCVLLPENPESDRSLSSSELRYRRLVEHSDAIIFHTDAQFYISFVSRRALDFFGVAPEDFVAGHFLRWFELVHPEDRDAVCERAEDAARSRSSFDEEYRVINRVTGRVRWLLTRFVPVRNAGGEIEGWDGFAVDITARREAQEALDIQSKKVRALYTVSSAIRGYVDPANIASRGLAALCDATEADAGICYLYNEQKQLKMVSQHGFSARIIERFGAVTNLPNLSHYVAEHSQSVVVPDMRSDPRASAILAEEEGLRSAVLVPICVEDETLGALGLFSKRTSAFDGGDVMLVGAAANQIGLAARQAQLFTAYKKQAKILAAVYRISHDLSRSRPLEEIFQTAFTIVREELGLKRLWLGLLNETGTRIVGQAAYGPGWKRQLVEINVEVRGADHPIARVVSTRRPIVIDNADEVLKEFGVKRIFSRLAIHSVALVPLNAGGQVLGVLAVQPSSDESSFLEDEITLLSNLANEIASILLTKRLEERIAEAEKMRTAGLLAGGVAHNFNNLLQAILGQASLLDMQHQSDSGVKKATGIINEAATKGAALVRQLLSFAQLEEPHREVCEINDVLERASSDFSSLFKNDIDISYQFGENLPGALVDPGQLKRIVTTLVENAVEALDGEGSIEIFTDYIRIGQASPHYEVPYGEYVRIGVRDSGIGMDEETKRRCFEPFFTTKNVDPGSGLGMSGSGLGLSAAYTLARRNGGRLVAEGRPGHGSVFTVYVPVAGSESDDSYEEDQDFASESLERKIEKIPFRGHASEVLRFRKSVLSQSSESAVEAEGGVTNAKRVPNDNKG